MEKLTNKLSEIFEVENIDINLKFSELPSTTISENLYKLVIENDIVKNN